MNSLFIIVSYISNQMYHVFQIARHFVAKTSILLIKFFEFGIGIHSSAVFIVTFWHDCFITRVLNFSHYHCQCFDWNKSEKFQQSDPPYPWNSHHTLQCPPISSPLNQLLQFAGICVMNKNYTLKATWKVSTFPISING